MRGLLLRRQCVLRSRRCSVLFGWVSSPSASDRFRFLAQLFTLSNHYFKRDVRGVCASTAVLFARSKLWKSIWKSIIDYQPCVPNRSDKPDEPDINESEHWDILHLHLERGSATNKVRIRESSHKTKTTRVQCQSKYPK
jgi:hypothetical protein